MQARSQCKHAFLFWSNKLFFLSSLLLFGLAADWASQSLMGCTRQAHMWVVLYTHIRATFHLCLCVCVCLFAFVFVPVCRCVHARRLQRMNQQVLTHVSESGLPAGLPAWRKKTPSMIKRLWPCFRGRLQPRRHAIAGRGRDGRREGGGQG